MEWEALLLGIEPIAALGVGIAALVLAPVIGALGNPEISKSISDATRNATKSGIKLGIEVYDNLQNSIAEAGESWNDLVAEAKTEVATSRNPEPTHREIEIFQNDF